MTGSLRVLPLGAAAVWVVTLALSLYFFRAVTTVLLGLVAAGVIAATLDPLARRVPGPRWLGALVVGFGFAAACAAAVGVLGWYLASAVSQQLAQWPEVREQLNGLLAQWSAALGIAPPLTVQDLARELRQLIGGVSGGEVLSRASGLVTAAGMVAVFTLIAPIFLLSTAFDTLVTPIREVLGAQRGPQFERAIVDVTPQLRRWLLATLLSMVCVGVASWIGYTVIGLRVPLLLALLAAVLEIVPTLGPLLTLAAALLIASTQGVTQVVGVLVVYVVVQALESYLILPLVMREAVRVPPFVTLFTIILWGAVLGPAGLVLAIPLDLLVWTAVRHFVIAPRAERRALRPAA
ncbi:MAG TPA: AI-2E family transporter [Candidatus Tectomicrobia bacterium]|nr:AI-2E family transporter [Candidatus Tectomicrobia bacterium]